MVEYDVNPFVPNVPFLYPLKATEKPYGFLLFSRGRERVHWERMSEANFVNKYLALLTIQHVMLIVAQLADACSKACQVFKMNLFATIINSYRDKFKILSNIWDEALSASRYRLLELFHNELFSVKIVKNWKPLAIFAKNLFIDWITYMKDPKIMIINYKKDTFRSCQWKVYTTKLTRVSHDKD